MGFDGWFLGGCCCVFCCCLAYVWVLCVMRVGVCVRFDVVGVLVLGCFGICFGFPFESALFSLLWFYFVLLDGGCLIFRWFGDCCFAGLTLWVL